MSENGPESGGDPHSAEKAEGERARLLRSFMQVPALIAILRGPDLVYEFANAAYREAANIPEPLGTRFGDITGHEAVREIREALHDVYANGTTRIEPERKLSVRYGNRGLVERIFHTTYQPMRDADGNVDAVLLHALDVTEVTQARRSAEGQRRELMRVQERLQTVLDNAPVLLWAVDRDGTITFAEGRGLESLGRRRGEAVGASVFDPEIAGDELGEMTRRALGGEEVAAIVESAGRSFDVRYHPLRHGGQIDGAIGVATDVTDRVLAEVERAKLNEKLLQVQKLESLGVLAGGIAHDFNNLLTAILGNASLALLKLMPESPARPAIDDLVVVTRRAADLTKQLLAYSGKGRFEVRRIDVSAHVREIAHLLEATIPKGVQLRLELAQNLPAVEADVAQVQQIVMNLVLNGAEAIGEANGTVLVATGCQDVDARYAVDTVGSERLREGRYVFVEVHDTGCGIEPDVQAKIFDPFFTTKFHGRGLGLAAVLGIVRAHKGAIKVYSAVGRGTTFKVFFPASDQPADPQERSRGNSFHGSGLVLLVDDEPQLRRTARRMLEHFSFDVVEAANGREAIEIMQERVSDVVAVLLDMTMPVLGGEETFRELRRIRADVPVILSSGYNEVEATRRFTSKGLAGFLQKPYSADELATKMEAALKRTT